MTLTAFSVLVGIADASLAPYAAFADGTGAPTVARFTTSAAPASWNVSHVADYPWAAQYFGKSSTFERFAVRDNKAHFVYADVVRTKSRSALAAYNVQNCFLFHRYHVTSNERTDLGHGVTGLLLSYTVDGTGAKWSTASWAWPVRLQRPDPLRADPPDGVNGGTQQRRAPQPPRRLRAVRLPPHKAGSSG